MLAFGLTLLRMIPGVGALISSITNKWLDTKATMYAERMGVTKAVAVAAIQAEAQNNQTKVAWLNAVAGSRFLQCIVGGFAFPLIVYMNKAYVWDNIVHKYFWGVYGYTPPMTGLVADWAGVIITGIFVTGASAKIADSVMTRISK